MRSAPPKPKPLPALLLMLCCCCCCSWLGRLEGLPLQPVAPHLGIIRNSYIRRYEPAWYDAAALRRHRDRVRREASSPARDQPLILRIRALDKRWTMRLVRDSGLFAKDAVFEGSNGPIDFDASHSYTGTLLEVENSLVQGVVTEDGLLDGSVVAGLEEFYIEPASRYLSPEEDTSPAYHTIAYRLADVERPPQPRRCASRSLGSGDLLRSYRGSGSPNETSEPLFEHLLDDEVRLHGGFYSKEPELEAAYAQGHFEPDYRPRSYRERRKRATVDPRKTTCMLYLQADHQFFSRYGTEEACIEVMTRHVQKVNSIYKHTDFNQDGRADNISFMIKRVKVHSGDALRDPNYRFPSNYGVEKYLELFSEEDYDAFCLAYMFTYRDFEMGTLGLAWTGDLKNAGGVCEKNGHYRGSMKSLNTGIVTLLNYGKHVPPAVSHVTLAHEIGHNFGSPHDPEQCTPGGEDGNFIMFARATSGDKRNNNRFSPCSLSAINPVLNTKARSPKGCFTEPQAALCGNGVVEEGEECDCGWEEDCRDSCCFPQRRYPPAEEVPCTLTPGSVCSPSLGPCCTTDCRLRFSDKCRDDNGCRDASFCDGHSPYCPPSINKPNKTICNQELVCFMGECTGSICLAYGLESCQCIPGPDDPPTKSCELCCRLPGENQPCLSSFDWNSPPYDVPDMFAKPGTPCNDYNGYCDVFQKCREVDPSGPLATLRKLLLSDETLATFRRWITEHWYAATLIVIGALSILVISTKLVRKRPGKKLKSVTIIHSSTTETVRLPPEGAEGVTVHPPAVRAKLPLSKKVREKRRRPKRKKDPAANEKSAKTKRKRVDAVKLAASPADENSRKRQALTGPDSSAVPAALEPAKQPQQQQQQPQSSTLRQLMKRRSKNKPEKPSLEGGATAAATAVALAKKKPTTGGQPPRPRKKKEVIDYSAAQADKGESSAAASSAPAVAIGTADPKSKVRSWLMASHAPVSPAAVLPKSKSSPTNLQPNPVAGAAPGRQATTAAARSGNTRQTALRRLTGSKSRSIGNLMLNEANCTTTASAAKASERVRLQVVYKPPFKFTVKLRKADKATGAGAARTPATMSAAMGAGPRTGMLVRTIAERKAEKERKRKPKPSRASSKLSQASCIAEPANSDLHTVPSDLEVLLSESEFLFSDT